MELITYTDSLFWEKTKPFLTCNSAQFINRLKQKSSTFEVTKNDNELQKFYVDFDHKLDEADYDENVIEHVEQKCLNYVKDSLRNYLNIEPNIAMAVSHTSKYEPNFSKYSVRIFVSNVKATKNTIKNFVIDLNKAIKSKYDGSDNIFEYIEEPKNGDLFDLSVYTFDRKMRCINTSKPNENRPLILKYGTLEQTIITACFDDNTIELQYNSSPTSVAVDFDIDFTDCHTEISKLLNIIGTSRCGEGDNKLWTEVAQVIKNEMKDDGLNEFVNWTNKYGSENKKKEAITHYQKYIKFTPKTDKKRLTIASLHYWAKHTNSTAYSKAFPKEIPCEIFDEATLNTFKLFKELLFNLTDYETAHIFNLIYEGKYICSNLAKKEYFCFNEENKLWEFDVGGTPIRNKFSTDFYKIFEKFVSFKQIESQKLEPNSDKQEEIKKEMKVVGELLYRLKKTNDKNNILREFSDICKNTKFETTLNRSKYLLPTNDGMILNMKTLISEERTIEHKFSTMCNAKLISYHETDLNFIKVNKYFDDLFCNNNETKQCVLNILKSVFTGDVLRYIYFCIGNGRNGKSLLFKILNKIFGKFMDVISESVIIEQKGNKSALNTEIEKLDKCRFGYVTELKETDKLNEKVIKQISGGDPINLRTIQTKDATVNPTCNLFVLTNEFPSFNGEAQSVLDRLLTIPFKATFKIDNKFEDEMLELSDYIFTYIMIKGVISDEIIPSAEMIEESKIHIKNNTETTLEDYLKDNLIDCINDKKENKILILNDVRIAFELYCQTNKLKNSLTQKKFTTKIKTLNYIIKESNGKTLLYNKKFKTEETEE